MSVGYTERQADRLRTRIARRAAAVNDEIVKLAQTVPDQSIDTGEVRGQVHELERALLAVVERRTN